ncbi:MAG TPA: SDR family oxidoreductase [Steroidobacteraceae bacterium]|nr:SDR family oxidoreductase [Steroidobacteraceae bacterium]
MTTTLMQGKVAVILGASAEGGIGWTTAESMAREGAKVVVAARSLDKLQQLAKKTGGLAVQCDATRRSDIVALADTVKKQFGKADAALYSPSGVWFSTLETTDEASLRAAMELHFFGGFFFVQEMRRVIDRNGAITLISSVTSTNTQDGVVAYSCAKGALQNLTRYAAKEFAPYAIRVNCVFPGLTETPLVAGATRNPALRKVFEREIPLGRLGKPSDIAEYITFLSSDRASYITGAFTPIDGGNFMTRLPRFDEMPSMEEQQAAMPQNTGH